MRIILILILFTFCLNLKGQVTISARILDSLSAEPLAGANVYLLTDFQKGTVSDENGFFEMELTDKQLNDTVLITFIGYFEKLFPAPKIPKIIQMKQKQFEMKSVEIRADPLIAEEFNYSKIKKLEIYKNPSASADPLLAVNSLPSSTTIDESASISFRGSSPAETGIFLNGVPVYDAVRFAQLNGIGTFSLFNTSLIKNVTVFPGNPPLEFGNTTSGVVAIETEDQKIKSNSNSLILSPANIGIQRNQKLGKSGLRVFSNYQPSGILKAINPNALDQLKFFSSIDLGAYIYGNISDKISYKSYNYTLSEEYKFRFNHPTFEGAFNQNKIRAFNASSFEMKSNIGLWKWDQGYSLSKSAFQFSATDINADDNAIFQSLSFHKRSEKLQYKLGMMLDSRNSIVRGRSFLYNYAMAEDHPTTNFSEELTATTLEAFAYAKYYFTKRLIIGSGLRKNLNNLYNRNYLSGQINTSYRFHENWKVNFGLGQYHKLGIIENQVSSLFIESQQSSLDIFYDKKKTHFSLSLFTKNNQVNSNSTQIRGAELYFENKLFSRLKYDVSITSLNAGAEAEYSNNDIAYFIRANLVYETGKYWTISLNGLLRQGSRFNSVLDTRYDNNLDLYVPVEYDQDRLNDYSKLNASISRLIPVNENFTMIGFLSVNNILNRKNIRNYSYNYDYTQREAELYSERLVYLGLQMNF